ncbi:MAG: pilus assembly PilX N-terminal domain-containing protein, partial [Acidobacteria bacterium]|nr:pilus assembly PilX N-terminal domain-containing protein [Acidobacteriota bacterium]
GVALIVSLLAIAVITSVGIALILSSQSETLIHGHFRSTSLALYAARGGLEEARGRMGSDAAAAIRLPNPPTNPLLTAADGIYIRRTNTIVPNVSPCTTPLNQNCDDTDPVLPTSVTYALTAQTAPARVPYAWAKITLATQAKLNRNVVNPAAAAADDVTLLCWNWRTLVLAPATNPTCNIDLIPPLSPVYIFTALAIEPAGGRRRVREIGTYGTLPPVPGPLTLDGPNAICPPPNSNRYQVNGVDAGTPPQPAPAIGVVTDADEAACMTAICALPQNRWGDYPGSDDGDRCPDAKKGPPPPNTSVDNVFASLDPLYQTCTGLRSVVQNIIAAADHVYTGPVTSLPDPGSPGNPVVNVVLGDATWAPSDFPSRPNNATGILLVTGNMVLTGYPDYDGIIFVIGNGSLSVSGGGTGTVNGGIFIANTTTCDPVTDLPTASPSFQTSGGGVFNIQFNSDLTQLFDGYMPIQRLSMDY